LKEKLSNNEYNSPVKYAFKSFVKYIYLGPMYSNYLLFQLYK